MPSLNIREAYAFYRQYILDYSQNKTEIYARYGFSLQGAVGSKDWEVFAAILLGDRARAGDGADLERHEVKSAVKGGSFEYQYHKKYGLKKLADDREIDHVFISRSKDFTDVEVWLVRKRDVQSTFDKWLPELQANYQNSERQRFRRSVTYNFVANSGQCLLAITGGRLDI